MEKKKLAKTLTEEQIAELKAKQANGELSDDELESVSGGGTCNIMGLCKHYVCSKCGRPIVDVTHYLGWTNYTSGCECFVESDCQNCENHLGGMKCKV